MKLFLRPIRAALLACVCAAAPALWANSATEPSVRPPNDGRYGGAAFLKRHEEFLKVARAGGIDVLFLGDSITDLWRQATDVGVPRGKPVWDEYFAPLHAANFGLGGDRTQNVLWRIGHGELDGIKPRVIVLLIGSNNLGVEHATGVPRNTTEEAIAGVEAVVRAIRAKLPDTKILLLGIFPRGPRGEPLRDQIIATNAAISQLDDQQHVFFLDFGGKFLQPNGDFIPGVMADQTHPNVKGYEIWAQAIQDPLNKLLGSS